MSIRFVLTAVVALVLAPSAPVALGSTPPARLQGAFAMTGRITTAVHIPGEHRGQIVSRAWTFTPLCSAGACRRVSLTRSRAGGADTLTLTRRHGQYVGNGRFYAPLNCGGTVNPQGELVPFTITVHVMAKAQTSSGLVATAIRATYSNRARTNLTNCVLLPTHDAARYTGKLSATAGSRTTVLTPRSPAGS
jgi:hypothetical protein